MKIGKLMGVQISKISPDEMVLQLRDMDGHFLLIALLPQEARAIASALNVTADQFSIPPGANECDVFSDAHF